MGKRQKRLEYMPLVYPNAAGLDIGSCEIFACVPPDRAEENVESFGTFTPDLKRLADWLAEHEVESVAMESTGVYWIPAFELLEARGFKAYLVNAQNIKGVPGRKSDVQDCQWIQKAHSLGLLTNSFRPDAEMCALRAYLRHRAELLQHWAAHIQHMQKALLQMNIQLPQVISDITGETGMAIVRAIVAGERDGVKLAQFRDPRCKSSEETIAKALIGTWKDEHLFALKQSLELYDFYSQQIAHTDEQVEQHYAARKPRWEAAEPSATPEPSKRSHRTKHSSDPAFDVQAHIIRITGVDMLAVLGIGPNLAQTILSEIGTDMTKLPSEKHFASWLGVAPTTIFQWAECFARGLCLPVTVPVRLSAKQRLRPAILRLLWALSIGVSGSKVVPYTPKWLRPTRSLVWSIIC